VTEEQRFWAKVDRSGAGCWLFGRTDALGYGRFHKKGPMAFAHRAAWIFSNGDIPAGMDVCHTCDVRNCCNPRHLWLGTAAENMADCKAKGRQTKGAMNKHATMTDEQVLELRREFRFYGPRKTNARELARRYNLGETAVYMAATGRTWKHLPMPASTGDSREGIT
jgi:hypothetical protein